VSGHGGQAYRIFQAAFNRAPDKGGLGYWMSALDHGVSLLDVADGFIQSKEFKDLYGTNPTNADLVNKYYANILHRTPDAAGAEYWTKLLDQHTVTNADVLMNISESAENQAALVGVLQNGFEYTPYG
jgi:hypothetical protein